MGVVRVDIPASLCLREDDILVHILSCVWVYSERVDHGVCSVNRFVIVVHGD